LLVKRLVELANAPLQRGTVRCRLSGHGHDCEEERCGLNHSPV
jgi:hypothetical protein